MQALRDLIGTERAVSAVSRALCDHAREVGAPITGGVLVTCVDEAEAEQAQAFHDGFVRHALPALKFGHQSAFRLAMPGGQYEFAAVRTAERNFAAAGRPGERKLMVVKLNAHTGFAEHDGAPSFGYAHRYGGKTPCCGALHVLLSGDRLPSPGLAEALGAEGLDRLGALRDPTRTEPRERGLRAALASVRLQARKVVLDVQDYADAPNTAWLIAACVTINRPDRDTEILCGVYRSLDANHPKTFEYVGLGDDPTAYRFTEKNRHLLVHDDQHATPRLARDHRKLLAARAVEIAAATARQDDVRLTKVRDAVRHGHHRKADKSGALLSSALLVLGEIAPVPAAMLLFARGAAGIHHTWRVHRIARDLSRRGDAQAVLHDVESRIDELPPDQREALLELLLQRY